MKRNTTIVLFASIFAVAVGTLGFSGNSAFLMVSAVPQAQENVGVLGHVEYTLLDEFGDIKAYMQNDNVVVVAGKDCAASKLFTDGTAPVHDCLANAGAFTFIAIGNGTVNNVDDIGASNNTLADTGDTVTGQNDQMDCAYFGPTGGYMAQRNATIDPSDITSGGSATVVVIDTADAPGGPFKFVSDNATVVKDSGLFNQPHGDYNASTGRCAGAVDGDDAAGLGNMFSRQLLNTDQGITVTDGDSLSVKWTITVG